MAQTGAGPLAVDLNVLKTGGVADPVNRDDVERALYALTGWQKPQALIDTAMEVIDRFAFGVKAKLVEVEPLRLPPGHHGSIGIPSDTTVSQACDRVHLDEHVCEITPEQRHTLDALDRGKASAPPLARVSVEDTAALVKAAVEAVQDGKPVRKVPVRNAPAMTPEELLVADVATLTPAQLNAYHTLVSQEQRCSACRLVKPLSEFYRDKARLTGHASRCSRCANIASAAKKREKREQGAAGA